MWIREAFIAILLLWPAAARAQTANSPPADDFSSYVGVAERIIAAVRQENDGYEKLERLCDDIGHRLAGSEGLEKAIHWAVETLKRDGHENVRTQKVLVQRWIRGAESLRLVHPYERDIPMLGLGGSIGTPPEGITAEVVVVASEEELNQVGDQASGKIVLFNVPMPADHPERGAGYGPAVRYRGQCATLASRHGAVAALVRSVTTRSMQSPHTGAMHYAGAEQRIPAAAISVEWAEFMARQAARGLPVRVTLKMEARTDNNPAPSANVIAELVGRENPDEVVVIGGHLDSWDVGQGAQDDGGGCVTAMEALNTLRNLNLRPRRTIRVVLFTNEENGLAGGKAYAEEHADVLPKHVAAIESDSGVFPMRAYGVSLADKTREPLAVERMAAITALLKPLGREIPATEGGGGADIGPMKSSGVPMIGHSVDMTHYFDYHHTHSDTLDKVNPKDLDENIAAMAVVAYVLADMPGRLDDPR